MAAFLETHSFVSAAVLRASIAELPLKRILIISGSRADYGLLEWPAKVLKDFFEVDFVKLGASTPGDAYNRSEQLLVDLKPDCLLILGDRWEILQSALAAHLNRIPIAHLAGGDVTNGSYDDAMRYCISRLATWHFPTSPEAAASLPYEHVHNVGNIALDFIKHGIWKGPRPYPYLYVVVNYQAETIDDTVDLEAVKDVIGDRQSIWITPNPDRGSERIPAGQTFSRKEYLNLIYHCEELIGNSSSLLYEAPALGVKTRMIGKRQAGRVAPTGDGKASERIREVLCRSL